ncbi:MAG: PEP-utilizing enzyme, partial [Stackebrandtia sp.]
PDHYVADKKSGKLVESALGRREVVIRSVAGGGTVESHDEAVDGPVLDATRIRELAGLGRNIENHYGAPQDTEWSLVDGRLYIVQARPITAMPEPIGKVSFPQRILAGILAEILTKRPYPLDMTSWTTDMFDGVRHFASSMGVRFPTIESMLVEESGVVVRLDAKAPGPTPKTPFILIRNLTRGRRFPTTVWEQDPRLHAFFAEITRLRNKDLSVLSYDELAAALDEALAVIKPVMDIRYDYIPRAAVAAGRFRITLARLGLGRLFGLLLTGAPTKTEETNRELEGLADRIRCDERLAADFAATGADELYEVLRADRAGRDFLIAFDEFLDTYGHREITSIAMASEPVWRDSPQTVLGILKGMAAADKVEPGPSAADRAYAELLAHPKLRGDRRKVKVLKRLAAARRFTSFREDTHFYLTMPQPVVRRVLLEHAARLAAAGVVDTPMDAFHLRRAELTGLSWPPGAEDTARLRALVAERAAIRERLGDAPLIDRRYFASTKVDPDAMLTGMPASAGRYTGRVRVISGPQDFHSLCEGEVLVAPFTNPAWTPLFQRAGAVIVDTGGPMSHAAIVAREYGIPAVLGTGQAVATLADGDSVTVDGDTGAILAAAASDEAAVLADRT